MQHYHKNDWPGLASRAKSKTSTELKKLGTWSVFLMHEGRAWASKLAAALPTADNAETKKLISALCDSTKYGKRPEFTNIGARTGYFIQKRNRIGNLPYLLMTDDLTALRHSLIMPKNSTSCKIASIGGGPAFDLLGLLLWQDFSKNTNTFYDTVVYDYERGWGDTIEVLSRVISTEEERPATLSFDFCDITTDSQEDNKSLFEASSCVNMFAISFVCVENYHRLFDSNFVFFRRLFSTCAIGAWFIFTDSTHRLWPYIWEVAAEEACFELRVVWTRASHYAMILNRVEVQTKEHQETQCRSLELLWHFKQHDKLQQRQMQDTLPSSDIK